MEENAESKEHQIRKLEATVKSLSEELIKVCKNKQYSTLRYQQIFYTHSQFIGTATVAKNSVG